MIRINEQYIDYFKLIHGNYYYFVTKGVYLSFDGATKEFMDVESFFIPKDSTWIQKKCDEKLNELLTRGILEFRESEVI